jgi:hypothetical protein
VQDGRNEKKWKVGRMEWEPGDGEKRRLVDLAVPSSSIGSIEAFKG